MSNYHDEIFKGIESIKENAADFIEGMLPAEFVSKLNLSTLELDKDSYVNENLKEHFSDLVYSCVYKGKTKIKISLLFEHKSSVPENPYLQMLEYIVGGWQALRKKKEPIIPIVCVIFITGRRSGSNVNSKTTSRTSMMICLSTSRFLSIYLLTLRSILMIRYFMICSSGLRTAFYSF